MYVRLSTVICKEKIIGSTGATLIFEKETIFWTQFIRISSSLPGEFWGLKTGQEQKKNTQKSRTNDVFSC